MNSIVLVGFMGTGKSRVARCLGLRLQCPVLDTDDLIIQKSKQSIAQIFQNQGEAAFRAWETKVLAALAAQPQQLQVIATGGGIVLADRNWDYLHVLGDVVCLTAEVDTILKRVGEALERPLLAGTPAEVRARIESLLQARQKAYAQADWICSTDHQTPEAIAEKILLWQQSRTERKE